MYPLSYILNHDDGKPLLRQYVYHVGSFHYNWHKEIEIICVLSGSIEVCAGGKVYELSEDDLLLINSNIGHATLSRVVDSAILLLRIDPSFFEKAYPDFRHCHIHLCSRAETRNQHRFSELRRCMAVMLLSHFSDALISTFAFNSAMYTFAYILLQEFPPEQQTFAVYSDKEDERNVFEIIRSLEERYQEKITLQDIAKRWNYSSTYASQLFKEYVGISFYDYLTRIRLRQATRELSETEKRIVDIASDNGFQDLKSFNTKFREIFGRSPSDYRKTIDEEHIRYDATFKKVFINSDDTRVMQKLRMYAAAPLSDDIQPVISRENTGKQEMKTAQITQELHQLAKRIEEISKEISDQS